MYSCIFDHTPRFFCQTLQGGTVNFLLNSVKGGLKLEA